MAHSADTEGGLAPRQAADTEKSRIEAGLQTSEPPASGTAKATKPWLRRHVIIWPFVLVVLIGLYYVLGSLWYHVIDDDPAFGETIQAPEGGSRAVAVAAALVDREINTHAWVANEPFFMPGSILDNTPNFQQGIMAALSRFGLELADQIGRTRGSSQVDPALETASGLLRYPGDVWIFDFSTSWAPTASSESQYRRAMRALRDYNNRVAAGNAPFERRADNLLATLDRMTADVGSASAAIAGHLEDHGGDFIDFYADDIFYRTKGRLYAYYLLLRAIREDFAQVIQGRDLVVAWDQLLDSMEEASTLYPWFVTNGAPDGLIRPSHLSAQGFYLLRARTQMKEITDILLK